MLEEYANELRISEERVAIAIGKKGTTKRLIEKKTKTKVMISREGDVIISGADAVMRYVASLIVRAIGRGFNPHIALLLLDEANALEIVEMKELSKGSKKKLIRIKSRLIGEQGKARMMLESLTDTHISIYGKTVAVIGGVADVLVAKQAIEKLLKGSPHGNVYRFISQLKKS